jgi:hypothetical protein
VRIRPQQGQTEKRCDAKDVLRQGSTPLDAPAFPKGPYRFRNREYLNVLYRTDPEALAAVVPEPLEVDEPLVRWGRGRGRGGCSCSRTRWRRWPTRRCARWSGRRTSSPTLTLSPAAVVHDYLADVPAQV